MKKRPKGKRERFSLNASGPMAKNRSVWETVRRYLEEHPEAKFADIESQFPARLQGSYGVVRTIEDINERQLRNTTESRQWFLDNEEILTAGDGIQFAVCATWGDNYATFQKYVSEKLGWTLAKAEI